MKVNTSGLKVSFVSFLGLLIVLCSKGRQRRLGFVCGPLKFDFKFKHYSVFELVSRMESLRLEDIGLLAMMHLGEKYAEYLRGSL